MLSERAPLSILPTHTPRDSRIQSKDLRATGRSCHCINTQVLCMDILQCFGLVQLFVEVLKVTWHK